MKNGEPKHYEPFIIRYLDDLHDKLKQEGFNLSRSALYLRLLPRRADTREGKLHLKALPIKLSKAQNDLHRQHQDGDFAATTIRNISELACLFGSQTCCYISMDNKARVPIGLTAANKQVQIFFCFHHLNYRLYFSLGTASNAFGLQS